MYYSASFLYPGDGPAIPDGWLRVEGGRIAATGRATDLPKGIPADAIRRFEGGALLPGLVNAHCHLEFSTLGNRLTPATAFPDWAAQLRSHTAGLDHADYLHAARAGARRLIEGGCTTVLDVGNSGAALQALAESPLRAFACVEALGQDPAHADHRFEAARTLADRHAASGRFHPGLAPHAAYSCSPALLRKVVAEQRRRGLPVTIHGAESREEAELFAAGTGPLADYCRSIFPKAAWPKDTTTVRWLENRGCLPDGVILVHGNTLDDEDMDILARRKATVVHCPSSHRFFGHPRFPYEELKARGINVALGTDSLASGDSLSMLEQMRLFAEAYPEVPFEEAVAMATVNGARALGHGDTTGRLGPGDPADFTVMDAAADGAYIAASARVQFVCSAGIPAFPD